MHAQRATKSAIIPPPGDRAADAEAYAARINRHVFAAGRTMGALKREIAKIEDNVLREATLGTNPLRR